MTSKILSSDFVTIKNMANLNCAVIEIETKHTDLCRELNMDKETEKISWKSYQQISRNFTLEGDPIHWLCCALYSACRESVIPTVGNSTSVVKGNCVSLTKILRSCTISIYEFFVKIKKWIEMTNLSQSFRNQVERLERSFSVSLVLYDKYLETFQKLFIFPQLEKKLKKSRPGKCAVNKLYDFSWCLFLCAKGEEPNFTVDLVTSFHLLLCCIDLIFVNALADNRKDLVNPAFNGLPKNWNDNELATSNMESFCIMNSLCQMHDASFIEAISMKKFFRESIIQKFVKHKTLLSKHEAYFDIISNVHFESNFKSLNNTYEQYVLSVGEFDERIFLSNSMFRKGNRSHVETDAEREKQSQINASISRSLIPGTPLTRRHHLPSKEVSEPVASATQNVKKLRLVAEKEVCLDFLKQSDENIFEKLESRLLHLGKAFCGKYPTKTEAEERYKLAKSLYYNLLEKIVKAEIKAKPKLDVKVLLATDIFHHTLIACCAEIVLAAYNSQIKFPWILECFDLHAFHFYKIIEIVVSRHEDALTRFIIIHLNSIEEKCLDSLVWRNNSPLWEAIRLWDNLLPSWVHVDNRKTNSMFAFSNLKKVEEGSLERNLLQSPLNSAYDCFNQANPTGEYTRRDLFNVGKYEKIVETQSNENAHCTNDLNSKRLSRAGSLSLFFRKFYKLAYMRISELCQELNMKNDEYLKQIWTLFEYSIVHKTDLMKDRHLDQILMCAIYVFIKVKDITGRTFTDIMKFYRNQPQAASNIYRHVLISSTTDNLEGNEKMSSGNLKYGDIIQFYNSVYVLKMTPYALNFGDKSKSQSNLLLSPHPPEKLLSPKKISNSHHLYIQPLEKKDLPSSPSQITYEFCKSPAKDLERINEIVKIGKRVLPFNDDEPIVCGKNDKPSSGLRGSYISRKIHGIIRDRQGEEMK